MGFGHKVMIGVYNDFIREIQVVDHEGNFLLIWDTTDEFFYDEVNHDHVHMYKDKPCGDLKETECVEQYKQIIFDALDFHVEVQLLRHDYKDPALKGGELGYHLDVYPVAY